MSAAKEHPIGVVARRTGLTTHVIRAWERRYDAVVPDRTGSNRRLYSDEDIERLILLRDVVATGRSIGQIAGLSVEKLVAYKVADGAVGSRGSNHAATATGFDERLDRCQAAVERGQMQVIERELHAAAALWSAVDVIDDLITPLMREIGDRWQAGTLGVFHEHMASAVVRTFLGEMLRAAPPGGTSLAAVAATPIGQAHELGALAAAVVAACEGWRVAYLGADSPAADIVHVIEAAQADVLLLGVTLESTPGLAAQLGQLRDQAPDCLRAYVVGGRGSAGLLESLRGPGVFQLESMRRLRRLLRVLAVDNES